MMLKAPSHLRSRRYPYTATIGSLSRRVSRWTCGVASYQGYDIVRVVLGLVLLAAAALKGYQLATEPVSSTSILGSRLLLATTVELELVFGLWLLVGFSPRATWYLTFACFAMFGAVSVYKALSGAESCGCFGRVVVSPWFTSALDVGALAALAVTRPSIVRQERRRLFSMAEFVVFAALLGAPTAVLMGGFSPATLGADGSITGDGRVVVLDPQDWVGRQFPLLHYIDIESELIAGEWTVVLYRHDCSMCHVLIRKYAQAGKKVPRADQRIALIEIPPFAAIGQRFERRIFRTGRLSPAREWVVTTPVVLKVSEGKVVSLGGDGDEQ